MARQAHLGGDSWQSIRVMAESKLEQATRHVAEGRRIVDQQRLWIAKAKESGRDTSYAEQLLDQFEHTLAIFEADL